LLAGQIAVENHDTNYRFSNICDM